jgi:hypothetical protein
LANPGITMFKNPTSKFQMFKGTDPSEGAGGAALAAARLRVTARSISHPPYFEPTRRLRERAEKTGGIPRACLPRHHHLFCQSFGRNFRRRNFQRLSGTESRAALPSSTPPLVLPKFQSELSWQRFSAHERRGNSQPAFLDITSHWPKFKPQPSQKKFSG